MKYRRWWSSKPKAKKRVKIIIPNGDGSFTEYKVNGKGTCKRSTSQTDNRYIISKSFRALRLSKS